MLSSEKLDLLLKEAESINENLDCIINLYNNLEDNYNEIKADLVEYNKQSEELTNKIFDYENTITKALTTLKSSSYKYKSKNSYSNIPIVDLNIPKRHINEFPEDNDTLIISEKDQKAYLPYKYKEIEQIYKENKQKYTSMQNVVNDLFIIPLSRFKNSSFSRFRESFTLIRNKEHGSITQALDLGLELMFKHNLNPIIIAACNCLDELDIYLDCLENNELHDFHCFKIKFEVSPKVQKQIFEQVKNSYS